MNGTASHAVASSQTPPLRWRLARNSVAKANPSGNTISMKNASRNGPALIICAPCPPMADLEILAAEVPQQGLGHLGAAGIARTEEQDPDGVGHGFFLYITWSIVRQQYMFDEIYG